MRHLITFIFLLLSILSFSLSAFAKVLPLYEEPKADAKQIGSLDTQSGIIAIYTPEKSDWMKVADPRDGKVGWVKIKDLDSTDSSEYTFTQRFIQSGTGPQSYQMIQFGNEPKMTPEQIQQRLKQIEQQQLLIQENMNKAMQNLFATPWYNPNMPFLMPVIVVPTQTPAIQNKATDQSKSSKPSQK